jgi:hypothetical protein
MSSFFREFFKGATLDVEDLYLLETFQIAYLPGWVPEREFAALLWAYPGIARFLVKRNPALEDFVRQIKAQHESAANPQELAQFEEEVVWTIADILVYQRCPEVYDALEFHDWDFGEVTGITPLEGKTVVEGGAGTGRVTLKTAQTAERVFAVEPVARLRQFIREKVTQADLSNVYVLDGYNHAIPLPEGFADVLITSHALGWYLEEELEEFVRVTKPGGTILHCPGTADSPSEEAVHAILTSQEWGYACARYKEPDGWKRKYWKQNI